MRHYEIDKENNSYLIVTVLVKCSNCGNSDILSEPDEIEFVGHSFHNSTDISCHNECDLCGKSDYWEEKAEHLIMSLPEPKDSAYKKFKSIDNIIDSSKKFITRLEAAQDNGFSVRKVLHDKHLIVLWKDNN